jgi:hypothetical protein
MCKLSEEGSDRENVVEILRKELENYPVQAVTLVGFISPD